MQTPPIPMEFADARTIRVTRLVESVALEVPEIREVFGMIDGPTSMSKFERILWEHLNADEQQRGAEVGYLAYYLTRWLGIRILQLPMMREKYFYSLSLEQFEGFRRIISCMARLEPLLGRNWVPRAYVLSLRYLRYALQHPDQIDLMSRGLQALTRLYKRFREDPIRSGSMSRHRTVVGFLPAYLVFERSDSPHANFNADNFREGLEWVIANELAFPSSASLTQLVAGGLFRLEHPMDTVLEVLGGNLFPEFNEMMFALDRIFRESISCHPYSDKYRSTTEIGELVFDVPKMIFAAVMKLGGMNAIEAPLRTQVLRIVPVLIKFMRAVFNAQLTGEHLSTLLFDTLQDVLAHLKPDDHTQLKKVVDRVEQVIPPLPTNPPPPI